MLGLTIAPEDVIREVSKFVGEFLNVLN